MIIGLTGKARSGKDTLAKHLEETHGYHHYWFSKPMKDACHHIFGWDDRHLYGELKEVVDSRYGVSPRYALQTIGTQWGRDIINRDLWLLRAKEEIRLNKDIVISDVRFDNEAEMILEQGGLVINIVRPDAQQVNEHESESGIDASLVSFTVENDRTIEDMFRDFDYVMFGGGE